MPTYEYLCEANGRVVEVAHKMSERIRTWGELCARAELPADRTPPDAPVTKLMSAGYAPPAGRPPSRAPAKSASHAAAPVAGASSIDS